MRPREFRLPDKTLGLDMVAFKRQQHGDGPLFCIASDQHGASLRKLTENGLRENHFAVRYDNGGDLPARNRVQFGPVSADNKQAVPNGQTRALLGKIQDSVSHVLRRPLQAA